MSSEWIDMSTFESINLEKATNKPECDSPLFLRVAANEEPLSQRAVVRNAFLTRVESDPTPSPYDSIPMSYWNNGNEVSTRAIPNAHTNAQSYYQGRNSLYFSDKTTS